MNFVYKLSKGEVDDSVHRQFIRFGKGDYGGRFQLSLWKTKKVKVKTSFEFANDLVKLCASFGKCTVLPKAVVLSKEDISSLMSENNIEGTSESKKSGLFYKNNIDEQELSQEQLTKLEDASYFTLMDLEGEGFKLKIKKKLPKPGKSEAKIDNKFCQLETEDKFYQKIKDDLFWDAPEAKKMSISHNVVVESIVMPAPTGVPSASAEGKKDYEKIRELAKRKGKIIRKITIDDVEKETSFDFAA